VIAIRNPILYMIQNIFNKTFKPQFHEYLFYLLKNSNSLRNIYLQILLTFNIFFFKCMLILKLHLHKGHDKLSF